ncbi:hypothetical protein CC80DRAFT_311829 [Byssothecium circinans]|uniref:Zn(2)-C6 fungal-type domain-containing protein n=1 Tax=Byssothecium circinans TaxID=147558 RepID=A0A6A5U7M4_9PLEO|nr:hypothetical protein CC80DRAFT_311829 [Byssothecium circinans]
MFWQKSKRSRSRAGSDASSHASSVSSQVSDESTGATQRTLGILNKLLKDHHNNVNCIVKDLRDPKRRRLRLARPKKACLNCRRRRIRCNNERTCGPCKSAELTSNCYRKLYAHSVSE